MAAGKKKAATRSLRLLQMAFLLSGSASLVEQVDKKLLVSLRDGRNIVGVLRSFDQFANVVLEDSVERIFTQGSQVDVPLGLFVVRGENVVLVGELEEDGGDAVRAEGEGGPEACAQRAQGPAAAQLRMLRTPHALVEE